MLAAELVDVDALWHVPLYSVAGTLGPVVAYGTVLFALDRGARDGEAGIARGAWVTVAVAAGLVCLALLALGIWAMTQKS